MYSVAVCFQESLQQQHAVTDLCFPSLHTFACPGVWTLVPMALTTGELALASITKC